MKIQKEVGMKFYLTSLRADDDQYKAVVMDAIRELLKRTGITGEVNLTSHQVLTALRQKHDPVITGGLSLAFHITLGVVHAAECQDSFVALVSISKDLKHGSVASLHRYEIRVRSAIEILPEGQVMVTSNWIAVCAGWLTCAHPFFIYASWYTVNIMVIDPTIFKEYDIRGIYPTQITEDSAYLIGRAIATLFLKENPGALLTMGVCGDMRISTPSLKAAIESGLTDSGINLVDIGLASTPTFYYAVATLGLDGGVQISASHNPAQYNGYKIVRSGAVPMSGDTGVRDIYQIVADESFVPLSNKRGTLTHSTGITEKAAQAYFSLVDTSRFKKFKVVVDAANAMGSLDYEALFKLLDAELVPMNFKLDGTFPAHEADPLKSENLCDLSRAIVTEAADFGIAADGDADRVFLLDEKGQVIPAESVYALLAQDVLQNQPTATFTEEVRFGRVVRDVFAGSGAELIPTPVGHSLIKKIMVSTDALMGGEVSGHFYFKMPFGTFEAPSYLILKFMEIISKADKPVSEIVAPYKKYANSGEVNTKVNSRDEVGHIIARIKSHYKDGKQLELDGIKVEYDNWWFIVRASNTEPVIRLIVEANTPELMQEKREELLRLIRDQKF